MKKAFICIVLLFMVVSCASHDVVRESNLSLNLDAQNNKVSKNGVDLMIKPIHLKSELATYFDEDLIKHGILPIQVSLQNNSEQTINFKAEKIILITPDETEYRIMSVEHVINKVKKSYMRTAGWTVAFGLIGAVPSMINVKNTNEKIATDYRSRVLKNGTMAQGTITEGLVFFKVPENLSSIYGWKFNLAYNNSDSPDVTILEYELDGLLEERKSVTSDETNPVSQ